MTVESAAIMSLCYNDWTIDFYSLTEVFIKLRKFPARLVLPFLLVMALAFSPACTALGRGAAIPAAGPERPAETTAPPGPPSPGAAAVPSAGEYDIGSPVLTDVWVDPVNGDDSHSGANRDQALRTITEAWNRIPQGAPLSGTGYRIQLVAGDYPDSDFPVYWESRYGSADFPILIQSADAPGSARLHGFVNVFDTRYLYLINLTVSTEGDVFHCEQCDHLLIRGVTMDGGSGHQAHETIKINQSQYVYICGFNS